MQNKRFHMQHLLYSKFLEAIW